MTVTAHQIGFKDLDIKRVFKYIKTAGCGWLVACDLGPLVAATLATFSTLRAGGGLANISSHKHGP